MRGVHALIALALLSSTLAGCIEWPDQAVDNATLGLWDEGLVAPTVDAAETLAALKTFSKTFTLRRGDNENHNKARDWLAANYEALGYDVLRDELVAPVSPTSTPTNALGSGRLVNIVGVKWGLTTPNEWIVVGGHYDVTDGAIEGAYDDGSGTLMVQKLAAAYANVPTARTILFINFDGEEQGLRGSRHMAERVAGEDWVLTNGSVVGAVIFDMAGITWPSAPPLVADVTSPQMQAVIEARRLDLGFPDGMVQYRPISGGNSDNGPFKDSGIPSVLFISAFDDMRLTSPVPLALPSPQVKYPFWHRLDTYEMMVQVAGGEDNLRAGFQNVLDIGSTLIFDMANGLEMSVSAP